MNGNKYRHVVHAYEGDNFAIFNQQNNLEPLTYIYQSGLLFCTS